MRPTYLYQLVLFFIIAGFSPLYSKDALRVFIVHSRAVSSVSSELLEASMLKTISTEAYEVTVFSESIHHGLDSLVGSEGTVESIIENRIERFQPDVVVVNGHRAAEKFATFRSSVFDEYPLVFCAIPGVSTALEERFPDATFIVDKFPLEDVLNLAIDLHPNLDRVVFTGTSHKTQNKYRFKEVSRLAEKYKDQVEVVEFFDVPVEIIYDDLTLSQANDVIIELERLIDSRGNIVIEEVFFNKLEAVRKVPVYTFWKPSRDYCVLGGKVFNESEKGKRAGELLIQMLEGKSIKGHHILDSSRYMFFYEEMRYYGITEDDLPMNSIVMNNPNRWSSDQKQVLVYIIIIAVIASLFIALLIWMNYRRMLSERKVKTINSDLKKNNDELSLLFEKRKEYLSVVSHDLKTPIAAIFSTSNLMADICSEFKGEYSQEMLTYTDFIQKASDEMLSRIDSILKAERAETLENTLNLTNVSIVKFMQELLRLLNFNAQAKNINVIYDSGGEDFEIEVDPGLIREIVNNLASNAIKFSNEDSEIRISTSLNKASGTWQFSIEDEGEGFSDEDKQHLFKRFRTLSAQPTANEHSSGLGLYIVNHYVSLHGGNIDLLSKKGEGAKFIVQIPLKPELKKAPLRHSS